MTRLNNESFRAAYETAKDANVACNIFEQLIARRSEADPIYFWEFIGLANIACSDEFLDYGWITAELRKALVDGDIYTYTGNRDYKWHINVPEPHILEVA